MPFSSRLSVDVAGRTQSRSSPLPFADGCQLMANSGARRPGERPRVLEEAVDWGVTGETLDEGEPGIRVFLAGLEERFQHREVRNQVGEGVPGEVFSGPFAPELAPVTGEQRGRVIVARAGLVRPRRGQTPGLYGVADALSTYRVDHARRVPDGHQALRVPFCAPHPHLQGPALRQFLRLGVFEVADHLRFLHKAVEEVLEVTPRVRKGLRRDAGPDVSPAVPEVEDPAVASPVLVHILREEDVQILLVWPGDVLEVLSPSHGVLVSLHPLRGEAADPVGGND